MQINVKIEGNEKYFPTYGSTEAAGADLRASLKEIVILEKGERKLIPTGLKMEIPEGYEGQIRPRSGLALKKGISIVNAPGTLDSDYRGPVGVVLINHGQEIVVIEDGDRIAQIVFSPVTTAKFTSQTMNDSERGEKGFGSTGTK